MICTCLFVWNSFRHRHALTIKKTTDATEKPVPLGREDMIIGLLSHDSAGTGGSSGRPGFRRETRFPLAAQKGCQETKVSPSALSNELPEW